MNIIAIANQKGGVGKTTTAVNLSACLARAGRRVLLIDLDQQVNATQHVGQKVPQSEFDSSYDLLVNPKCEIDRLILPAGPNLSLIPAHIALAEADLKLASAVNPDGRLKRVLSMISHRFDYCVIDCPPSLGRATINALNAATHLIVAVETAWFAYEAVQRLSTLITDIVEQANPALQVYALATLHRVNVKMHLQVLERIKEVFLENTFETVIRHSVAFVEASAEGQSIGDYANGCRGHQDYQNFAKEVMNRVEKVQAGDTALSN